MADWDEVAETSDEAWLWHRHVFGDALATWRGSGDRSFALIAEDGRVAATMPLHRMGEVRARGLVEFAQFLSLGGVATAAWLPEKRRASVRQHAIRHAMEIAAGQHGVELNVMLAPLAPAYRGERCPRVNPLIDLGLENAPSQTWMVDMRGGRDAVWEGMRQRGRRMVRKAESAGVEVRVADRPGDLDTYYRLHVETYERTGAETHPRGYFERIWQDFIPAGLAKVWFGEIDGEPVAARNFGIARGGALYWTGASSQLGLDSGASALLQWRAMEWMCENGIEWSESGEAFPGSDDPKSRGLSQFKGSFGGELYPLYRGRRTVVHRRYEAVEALGVLKRLARP